MAKAVTAYADNSGKIHAYMKSALAADDALAAKDAWRDLERKTQSPARLMGGDSFGVQYPTVDYMINDRLFIEAVFRAVDRAAKGR
ncbi:hypothetical protein HFN51_04225 [Rhizobium leguminosarum]|nr:hypothetical protein [Rhizobium leguminosarum]